MCIFVSSVLKVQAADSCKTFTQLHISEKRDLNIRLTFTCKDLIQGGPNVSIHFDETASISLLFFSEWSIRMPKSE